jgi:hypothetical protein
MFETKAYPNQMLENPLLYKQIKNFIIIKLENLIQIAKIKLGEHSNQIFKDFIIHMQI